MRGNDNEETQRDANLIPADRTGKIFAPLGKGVLLCLICEGVFTRQSSREHANLPCLLAVAEDANSSLQYPICVTYLPVAEK